MYEIAKQPKLQKQIVQEISSTMGDKNHPSWEDLQKMSTVRNCVKEIMRLHPPVTTNGRILAEDAVILGYHIPAGVSFFERAIVIMACVYCLFEFAFILDVVLYYNTSI